MQRILRHFTLPLAKSWQCRLWAALAAAMLAPASCFAQAIAPLQPPSPPAAERQPETIELLVTAQAPPVPALEHRFWPSVRDLQEGNAERSYLRAVILIQDAGAKKTWQQYNEASENGWANSDHKLEGESLAAAKKWLRKMPLDAVLVELRRGAMLRNNSLRIEIGDLPLEQMFAVLLPEIQEMRSVARMLLVEIRVLIAEGRYEEAVERLRIGYRMAGSFSDSGFLISRLVGTAIAATMTAAAEQLAAAPDAPNLYWALATLPRPVVPTASAARFEIENIKRFLTTELDAVPSTATARQWTDKLIDTLARLQNMGGQSKTPRYQLALGVAAGLAVTYPQARQALLDRGLAPQQVESMSAAEAVLRWTDHEVRKAADDQQKWTLLPDTLRPMYMARGEAEMQKLMAGKRTMLGPQIIIGLLMPAISAAGSAEIRTQTFADLLQTAEAVRAHAGVHGKLPDSLEDLYPVPALPNPRSGKAFSYQLEKQADGTQVAMLAVLDSKNHWENRIYRISLRTN